MENFYIAMLKMIRRYPFLERAIIWITKYFPIITFVIYPCVCLYLIISHDPLIYETIWKPLVAFLTVTVFRKLINRPRPYDAMNIQPLVGHKHGESFPSRHAVSAFIIAFMCLNVHPDLGVFTLMIAVMVSLSRILAGVHYISDVLTAVIIAFLVYLI